MKNYFIKYKIPAELTLDQSMQIDRPEPFIKEVIISTETEGETRYIVIGFNISDDYDDREFDNFREFFAIQDSRYLCPSKIDEIKSDNNLENIDVFIKRKLAVEKSMKIVDDLISVLDIELDLNIENKDIKHELNLPKPESEIRDFVDMAARLSNSYTLISNNPLSQTDISNLQNKLSRLEGTQFFYYSLFRKIKQSKEFDLISKYMLYYSILVDICSSDKTQTKVDDFIVKNKFELTHESRRAEAKRKKRLLKTTKMRMK